MRKMPQMICVLGDLLVDVIVRVDGPIAEDTDTYGRTKVGAGGQAANVAAWVAALGGRSRFIGKRADDAAGRLVAEELEEQGVDVVGPVVDSGTGTVVSIATPDGKRTMLSDRGVAPSFRTDELDPSWLGGCERLHLPAYSVLSSPIRETALAAAALAPVISLDLSSVAAIHAAGVPAVRAAIAELRPDVVFANEEEAALVGALDVATLVVKRGARGCSVRRGSEERDYPAEPAEPVDSTGAGDAFAAGFLLAGPELALQAAARCVAKLGAMP
jgi:sugar/nucleoside kinase (ribokinase family)